MNKNRLTIRQVEGIQIVIKIIGIQIKDNIETNIVLKNP